MGKPTGFKEIPREMPKRRAVECERFVKIMPRDYKAVLEATRRAEAEGVDPLEAVMAAAHG